MGEICDYFQWGAIGIVSISIGIVAILRLSVSLGFAPPAVVTKDEGWSIECEVVRGSVRSV